MQSAFWWIKDQRARAINFNLPCQGFMTLEDLGRASQTGVTLAGSQAGGSFWERCSSKERFDQSRERLSGSWKYMRLGLIISSFDIHSHPPPLPPSSEGPIFALRALSLKWTPLHLPCVSWLGVYIGLCYQLAFAFAFAFASLFIITP